jgi:hypothetical protein
MSTKKREWEWCDDERSCSHTMKSDYVSPSTPVVDTTAAAVYADMGAICKSIARGCGPTTDTPAVQYIDYEFEPVDATFDGDDDNYDTVDRVGVAVEADNPVDDADADCADDGVVVVPPKANSHAYI